MVSANILYEHFLTTSLKTFLHYVDKNMIQVALHSSQNISAVDIGSVKMWFLVDKVGFGYGAKTSFVKAWRQDNWVEEQMFDTRQSQASDQAVCVWWRECLKRSAAGSDVDDVTPLGILSELWITAEEMWRVSEWMWLNMWLRHQFGFYIVVFFCKASSWRTHWMCLHPAARFLESWLFGDHWNWMRPVAGMAMR